MANLASVQGTSACYFSIINSTAARLHSLELLFYDAPLGPNGRLMVKGGLRGGGVMVGVIWSTRTLSIVIAGRTYKYKYMYVQYLIWYNIYFLYIHE